MLRADLHVHTAYSLDCAMSLEQVINQCLKVGINCVAVTDHGTIAGALKLQSIAPFPVIVGEEVLTSSGEVIGLFLTEEVPGRLPAQEAVARIKAQGGLVGIPHPFDHLRLSALKNETIERILPHVDFIEVFNSRNILLRDSERAKRLAQRNGLLSSAGSDAHTPYEIGHAYVEMPEFNGRDEFCRSLAQGKVFGRRTNPMVHIVSSWARLRKSLKER